MRGGGSGEREREEVGEGNTGLSLFGEIFLSFGNISDIKNTKSSEKNARPTALMECLMQFCVAAC